MNFEYLDSESEKLLGELLSYEEIPKHTFRGAVVEHLINLNYLKGKNTATLSDVGPCYIVTEITQKGKSYFEMKDRYERDQRKLSRREWMIAMVGVLIGGLIGLMPTIIQWVKGLIMNLT